jgi:GntR family transcriptional repressor for pyruvate dehydrogenase complex
MHPGRAPMFSAIPTRRIFETIADEIRKRIFAGTLSPGDKLPGDRDLAAQFGVGRMVVREAFRTLEVDGLIRIRQGADGGAFIKEADHSVASRSIKTLIDLGKVTVADLTEARIWLEQAIVEQAAERRTDEDLRQIEANILQSEAHSSDFAAQREINRAFNMLVAAAAKNPIFSVLVHSLTGVVVEFLEDLKPNFEYVASVPSQHRRIFEAIRDRDVARARAAVVEHLRSIESYIAQIEIQRKARQAASRAPA